MLIIYNKLFNFIYKDYYNYFNNYHLGNNIILGYLQKNFFFRFRTITNSPKTRPAFVKKNLIRFKFRIRLIPVIDLSAAYRPSAEGPRGLVCNITNMHVDERSVIFHINLIF